MPKQKITREMVVGAAFQLAREGGMERVLVKDIAARLGCSVQPIYSCFRNMGELRRAVELRTADYMADWLSARLDPSSLFQSTGRAYVQFAQEEPELFKLFGDSTRIRILYVLFESELCVCGIAEVLGMTQSAISHQLQVLKRAKLVKYRREGKTIFYSLADSHVRTILDQGMEHIAE